MSKNRASGSSHKKVGQWRINCYLLDPNSYDGFEAVVVQSYFDGETLHIINVLYV